LAPSFLVWFNVTPCFKKGLTWRKVDIGIYPTQLPTRAIKLLSTMQKLNEIGRAGERGVLFELKIKIIKRKN
jgi:hypothetical protein